ncbi:MAG: O-antigen ligase family protein [Candidatus Helarchaeota archaeon]
MSLFIGGILCFCLINEFYFYQAVVIGLLILPILFAIFIYNPDISLLSVLIIAISFNPRLHIVKSNILPFSNIYLDFWTSDLIIILIFVFLFFSTSTGVKTNYKLNSAFWYLGIPLLLWIGLSALSIYRADIKSVAFIELVRMLRIFVIFFIVYKFLPRSIDIQTITKAIVIALAIQSIIILTEYYVGHPVFRIPGESREADIAGSIFRPSGTMGHSSGFAKFAALCLPICLATSFAIKKKNWRIFLVLVIISGFVSLVLTVSRASVVISLFGMFWVLFLTFKSKGIKKRKTYAIIFVFSLAIGISWFIGGNRLVNRFKWDYGSALSRPAMYSVAWNVIKTHPFLGVGLNNYTLVAPKYDNTQSNITKVFPHPVHNIYLLYAAEIGIIGSLFFIVFIYRTIRMYFRESSRFEPVAYSIIYKAIGIGLICCWLQGLICWGHRVTIVHMSYLAFFAGFIAARKNVLTHRENCKTIIFS